MNIEELQKAQKTALKSKNYEELGRINRQLFAIREAQRKAHEREREEYRNNVLSTKISRFCENFENAKRRVIASENELTM